jgi:phospholipase/carboxylesterase
MSKKICCSRRELLQTGSVALLAANIPALLAADASGRLAVRHGQPSENITPGAHVLDDNNGRRAILYVPPGYDPAVPAPFMLMLHGARGDGDRTLESQRAAADEHGVVLLNPSTRSGTWDAIRGRFAHDLEKLDILLGEVFERCNIDPGRIASGGFSDGASYALSLGLINGDLFTHIIAHSPGFIISGTRQGKPAVYVSHGRQDEVLPFDRCGAAIVAKLEKEGYEPRFDVFDGGHTASPELRSAALAWLNSTAGVRLPR